jgi:hypothetical protein
LPLLNRLQRYAYLRGKWPEDVKLGAASGEDDYAQLQCRDVLLEGQIAVRCQEDVEDCCGSPKQLSILDPRPARFDYGLDVEARKVAA